MVGSKNLQRLDVAIEKLNVLIDNESNKDNIINELNDIYVGLENDLFSYMNKIEEMEEDLEILRNKDGYCEYYEEL